MLLSLLCVATQSPAREVVALEWPTRLAAQTPQWEKPLADWMPMFRIALATVPEGTTVSLALSQPGTIRRDNADTTENFHRSKP